MSVRLAVDVGGTFTDYVASDGSGTLVSGKTPSTPGHESLGVMRAIEAVSAALGLPVPGLLARTEAIDFGTTVATNALLEHRGGCVGMLTTRGFRDVIDLRRGYKESLVDIRLAAPVPLVPRRRRAGVTERIGSRGDVLVPLDEDEALTAIRRLRAAGVDSYAVCLLQSPVNPAHERRCAELIRAEHPEAFVTVSCDVLNQLGEFERFSTTLMNAYLSPVLRDYVRRLLGDLRAQGFAGRLLVMRSNGGIATDEEIGEAGVGALLSGPAGGVVAASTLAVREGFQNIIGVDMGGTSYDMSVVEGGRPQVRTDAWASRYRIGLPLLDIHTIGAGGGSLAWVDGGGALRVGPQSAGAVPGPACYGRGGEHPTVTDANLVLGYLGTGTPLGGTVRLDEARARSAIAEHVGDPLGLSVDQAAIGIHRIVNGNMTNGIRYVSVARGRDPRNYALLAFGGAAATHAPVQARDLGIRTVLVPTTAGVLSALGALLSDLKTSTQRAYLRAVDAADVEEVAAILERMWRERRATVKGRGVVRVERQAFVDMRYEGQVHELTVPLAQADGVVTPFAWRAAVQAFHAEHERLYTFRMPDKPVLAVTLRLDLVGVREKVAWEGRAMAGETARAPAARPVWLPGVDGSFQQVEAAVHDGRALRAGASIDGPAIIEEESTTIVLHGGDRAVLDEQGIYRIAIAVQDAAA